MIKILTIIALLFSSPAFAKKEREYQEEGCKGAIEFILNDKTRVDCLTVDYAIEYEFAAKWKSGIGQALHYGKKTFHEPGIVLIMTKESDKKYLESLQDLIKHYRLPIKIWIIEDYNDR